MTFGLQEFISIIVFAITIGGLIWNMAKLHTLAISNKESLVRAHQRIDRLEDILDKEIKELHTQFNVSLKNQARMEEKLTFLVNSRTAASSG